MEKQVQIRKVDSHADFKAFFEFPWVLYRDDPNWVPSLLSMRRELLDKKKNPAWRYMEGDYFTAWRGEQIVGTITAFINHRHNEFHQENIGWFGTFEVYDDSEAAAALLDTAGEWVRARGYNAIRGPQSFTTHEECGLLVENFSRPALLMPYNPPYYQKLIEGAGFRKAMDVWSLYIDHQLARENDMEKRIETLVRRASQRSGITVRPINTKNLKAEFELLKEIYNAAWDENWGFVPMTVEELDAMIESLGQFFDPRFAFFAEVRGEPAGFSLAIPDFNTVLRKVYPKPGVPEIWSLLQAGWYWKVRKIIRGARLPLLGVKAEYRNRGVELALFNVTIKAFMPSDIEYVDAGWILETNSLLKICDKLGMKHYKTHRFYEKTFR